jgi:hypothetical protein
MTSTAHTHPETAATFETKTGFCHIFPDRIVLSRDGIAGEIASVTVGNNIARILVIYGMMALGFLAIAIDGYRKGILAQQIVPGVLAVVLICSIVASRNNSAAPVIGRSRIRKVTFRKAIPGFTRSHFVVRFEDERGKLKKRLIMLPGSLTGGPKETEKAVKIMTEAGLIGQR